MHDPWTHPAPPPAPCSKYSFVADQLAVNIGAELLTIVPGRVRGRPRGRAAAWAAAGEWAGSLRVLWGRTNQEGQHPAAQRLLAPPPCSPLTARATPSPPPPVPTPGHPTCLPVPPTQVSTEVDAHLSHDGQATYDKALHLVDLYVQVGGGWGGGGR